MNLLCPNCGKMLTVPEQYAGQLMKCPLCSGTFTVPALPPGGSLDAPAPPQPAFSSSAPDPYHLQQAPPQPAFDTGAPPEPAFQTAPPPTSPPAPKPAAVTSGGPSLPPPPTSSGEYQGGFSIRANEKILQWVPPAALLLIFVLQFFPWIGVYVGNHPVATQGAWGAAFGSMTDPNLNLKGDRNSRPPFFQFTTDETKDKDEKDNRPGVSVLLLFYMLLFLPALLITIAVAVLPFLTTPLPPQVQQLLPWRWAIVAGLNAILLLFLALQMLLNFGLESSVAAHADSVHQLKADPDEKDKEIVKAKRSSMVSMVQRTFWLKLVFLLHILATAAAALVFWIEKRGSGQPPPALEFKW